MSTIKLVVLDVAGTIIQDRDEVLDAFLFALEKHGVSPGVAELREWKGASKREAIQHFVVEKFGPAGQKKVDPIYSEFRENLEARYRENGIQPIRGADATLRWLKEQGMKVAATSGFYRKILDLILKKAGWSDVFDATLCSSDVKHGRPAPYMIFRAMELTGTVKVSEVMVVGDTPLDLKAGQNAGVAGIVGVLTGAHKEARLRREKHTHIIASVAELPGVIHTDFRE